MNKKGYVIFGVIIAVLLLSSTAGLIYLGYKHRAKWPKKPESQAESQENLQASPQVEQQATPPVIGKAASLSAPPKTWFKHIKKSNILDYQKIHPINRRVIHGSEFDCYKVPRKVAFNFKTIPEDRDVIILLPHPQDLEKERLGIVKFCIGTAKAS